MDELSRLLAERGRKAPDYQRQVSEWQSAVGDLCRTLEGYLAPLRDAGRLQIDYRQDATTEEDLGTYATEGLALRFMDVPGQVEVTAKSATVVGARMPSGGWVSGVNGRVDMSYGALRLPIVRRGDAWCIGLDDDLVPMTEASVEQALRVLLGL